MKKIVIILVFALLLPLVACNVNSEGATQTAGQTMTMTEDISASVVEQTNPQASQTPEQTLTQDINQYMFYAWRNKMQGMPFLNDESEYVIEWIEIEGDKPEGIYRYNLDGTGETLWVEGSLYCIGVSNNWMYYCEYLHEPESHCMIYKADVSGQQRQVVVDIPSSEVVIGEGVFYYSDGGVIHRIKPGEEATVVAKLPDSFVASVADLITDGKELYFTTHTEWPEWWDLYHCDIETGVIKLVLEDIHDSFLVKDMYIYHTSADVQISTEGYIYRYEIETGENIVLYETGCTTYDLVAFDDWLVYMTSKSDMSNPRKSTKYINGLNLKTSETFTLESPGSFIYNVLPTQVNIYDSIFEGLKGRLVIGDGIATVEEF